MSTAHLVCAVYPAIQPVQTLSRPCTSCCRVARDSRDVGGTGVRCSRTAGERGGCRAREVRGDVEQAPAIDLQREECIAVKGKGTRRAEDGAAADGVECREQGRVAERRSRVRHRGGASVSEVCRSRARVRDAVCSRVWTGRAVLKTSVDAGTCCGGKETRVASSCVDLKRSEMRSAQRISPLFRKRRRALCLIQNRPAIPSSSYTAMLLHVLSLPHRC